MLKNKKSKIVIIMLLIITLISTFSFAADETNDVATVNEDTSEVVSEDTTVTTEDASDVSTEDILAAETENDIQQGDLYIAELNVTMDKIVNGNVYIIAKKVKITGQISGNLFVCADELEFEDAYIESSVYACANTIEFKAVASDLYACCSNLNIPANYGVYRDLRCATGKLNIYGIIGRDVFAEVDEFKIQDGESLATIYGNLNYNSKSEIEVPEGAVTGIVKYSKSTEVEEKNYFSIIKNYVVSALSIIIVSLVIYGISSLISKKSDNKTEEISVKKYAYGLVYGLVGLIIGSIICVLLLILSSIIGMLPFVIYLSIYIILLLLSIPIFNIEIGKIFINKFNIKNVWLKILVIALVALVVYLIGIIPIIKIIKMIFFIIGFGLIISCIISKIKK